MSGRDEKRTGKESPKRQQRAQRILDATTELVQRWGYKKTAIDDIARQAGVAKGTIYLHWKTREELFEALLAREWLLMAQEIRQCLATDPESITLHILARQIISITMRRPLVQAMLAGNSEILDAILHSPSGTEVLQMRLSITRSYLELLRRHGLIRNDMELGTQITMLSAISIGFLTIDHFLPESYRPSPEAIANMLAETLQRTFEPEQSPTLSTILEATHDFNRLFEQFITNIQQIHPEIVV